MGDGMPKVEVSIVIPIHNRWSFLPKVIEEISSQTFKDWEIVIVDDASDATPCALTKNERIRYFKLNRRKGSGYARNFGAKRSHGNFILFVDDDTIPSPTYLEGLLMAYEQDQNVGAVGGRLVYIKDENEYFNRETIYDTPVKIGAFSGEILGSFDRKTKSTVEVPVLHTLSLLRKDDFLKIGGFDETTYVGNRYREETDLFLRIRQSGRKLLYNPNVIIYHFDLRSGGQKLPLIKYEYYVLLNHILFLKKFYSPKWFSMLFCFVFRRLYDRGSQILGVAIRRLGFNRGRKLAWRFT